MVKTILRVNIEAIRPRSQANVTCMIQTDSDVQGDRSKHILKYKDIGINKMLEY